jgi:hypothetical protein
MTENIPEMDALHKIRVKIKTLKERLAKETAEFELMTDELRDQIARTERDFQKMAKTRFESGNPIDSGKYLIIESHRTTRTVNTARFRDAYPILFAEIATVPVKKAEEAIGKINLDPLCDLKVSESTYDIGVITATKKAPVDEIIEQEVSKPIFHCSGPPY